MQEEYPLLIDRLQSAFIDLLLIVMLMFVCTAWLDKWTTAPEWVRITIFVILFIAYEPLCMTLGFTAGNYIKRIRVRKSTDTSKRINILQAIVRYPIKIFLGWISFLTINSNPQRRAIHDFVSGTV